MGDIYDAFEINETDLEIARNPLKRRKFTKNQQIYGMFADDDEEENNDKDVDSRGRRKKDYSAPMSFISGGVNDSDDAAGSSGIGQKVENADNEDEDDDQEENAEFYHQRRSFKASSKSGSKKKTQKVVVEDFTAFAGIRNSQFVSGNTGSGGWEKHTKGIGAKLLNKMGYKPGEGLGKSGQGIVKPVEAVLRPGRGAIGAYGPERKKEEKSVAAKKAASSGGVSDKQGARNWQKSGDGSKKSRAQAKPKTEYKTWDEVVADGGQRKSQFGPDRSNVKIIDMTGKEQKVYTGYDVFRGGTRFANDETDDDEEPPQTVAFDLPELRHNLDLLVEMTEDAIVRNDRQRRFLDDQKVALIQEENQLTEEVENDERHVERLKRIVEMLEKFSEKEQQGEMTLEECKELIEQVRNDYYEEYKMYDLASIAVTNVLPLLRQQFANWHPLNEPTLGFDVFQEWKEILEDERSGTMSGNWSNGVKSENMHPFHQLLWEAWMPPFRRCVIDWNPKRDYEAMILAVNRWSTLLPTWMLENVLERLILPRLVREVENWNPMVDTTPIHFWLHPWLPLMGDRLQQVYAPIRQKLGRALSQWHPSDPSAKNILRPWQDVFAVGAMQSFLSQHILPKLELCVANLAINPADQDLQPWHWVMDWLDLINPALIANILVQQFFPKWHRILLSWITCPTANYNEISQWYSNWKSLMPSDIVAFQVIRDQFKQALELMNQVLSGGVAPTLPNSAQNVGVDYSRVAGDQHRQYLQFMGSGPSNTALPANFKDLVERKAEEHGLLFMPVPNKFREAKPVYRFGLCQVYIDRNVVFMLQPSSNQWIPVSLDQLVSSATG